MASPARLNTHDQGQRSLLSRPPQWLKLCTVVTLGVYPLLVYSLIGHLHAGWLVGLLMAAASLRLLWQRNAMGWVMWASALLITVATLIQQNGQALRYYPVAMNAAMLILFTGSLRFPPTMVERFARLQESVLNAAAIAYTRRVTQVWCAFFVLNGAIALATALWASDAIWALYNGLLAYLLMAVLGAAEWLVRQRVRARHASST